MQAEDRACRQALHQLREQQQAERQLAAAVTCNFVDRVARWRGRWLLRCCTLAWRCMTRCPRRSVPPTAACPAQAPAAAAEPVAQAAAPTVLSRRTSRPQLLCMHDKPAGSGSSSEPGMVCLRSRLASDGAEATRGKLSHSIRTAAGPQPPQTEGRPDPAVAALSRSARLPATSIGAAASVAQQLVPPAQITLSNAGGQQPICGAGSEQPSCEAGAVDSVQQLRRTSSLQMAASTEAPKSAALSHAPVSCRAAPDATAPALPAVPTADAAGSAASRRAPSGEQIEERQATGLAGREKSCCSGPDAPAGRRAFRATDPANAAQASSAPPRSEPRHRTRAVSAGDGEGAPVKDVLGTSATATAALPATARRAGMGIEASSSVPATQPRRAASAASRALQALSYRRDGLKAAQLPGAVKRKPPAGIKKLLFAGATQKFLKFSRMWQGGHKISWTTHMHPVLIAVCIASMLGLFAHSSPSCTPSCCRQPKPRALGAKQPPHQRSHHLRPAPQHRK